MAKLKITEIGRNWWNRRSRRDIYINGKHSGVLTGGELDIEVSPGPCKVTVQNTFPSFRSTAYINIEEKAENHVDFRTFAYGRCSKGIYYYSKIQLQLFS